MASQPTDLRGLVSLVGYDSSGRVVFDEWLSYENYYGESHPVIDDASYRVKLGIRRVYGKVFDLDGIIDQNFENTYSADGEYLRGRAEHSYGTIIEN